MVGVCLGIEPLRVVLVGSLDLGYDVYAVHPRVHFSARAGTAELAWMAGLGSVRGALRNRRAGESDPARVSPGLRFVDLAPEIPSRSFVAGRSFARFGSLLGGAVSV